MRNDLTSEKNKKELFFFFVYTHLSLLLLYKHEIQRKDAEIAIRVLTFPGEPEGRRLSCIHLRWET